MPVTVSTELHVVHCSCGGVYAITESHCDTCRRLGQSWHCPYCRSGWGFHESEADKLRKQLAVVEQEKARLSQHVDFYKGKRDDALKDL